MSEEEPPPYEEPPALFARHFVTCRLYWYDHRFPERGFALSGIYTAVEPPEGTTFPFRLNRVFVYAQLWGDEAEHRLWVRFVRIELSEAGDEVEVQLGMDEEPIEFPMPGNRRIPVSEVEYVTEVVFPIGPIGFREPGLYEYQIWAEGYLEPIARERVLARE